MSRQPDTADTKAFFFTLSLMLNYLPIALALAQYLGKYIFFNWLANTHANW